jgi:hypothetical protein
MMINIRVLILVVAGLFVANSRALYAERFFLGNLEISNVWAWETPGNSRTAAIYIERISNKGSRLDSLIKISSQLAAKHLIHKTVVEKSIAKMIHIDELKVLAGESLSLKPGSFHIMMFDIQKKLVRGFKFPVLLEFRNSGKLEVFVEVKPIGAATKKMNHKKMHKH